MKSLETRIALIDVLKVVAMQLIVLHHMASYGPLAEAVRVLFPESIFWLYDHGRIAVQVFLVIGGYLAARVLSPHGEPFRGGLATTLINRYLRLTPPYMVAILLAVACAAFARKWINDEDFIPAAPLLRQWLAHVFLLHDLLSYEALSAGVWYVAIDFQLFVLLAALLWLSARLSRFSRRAQGVGVTGVLLLSIASLFWFNRNPDYDIWAMYFFVAYGLGAVTYWSGKGSTSLLLALRLLWLIVGLALLLDFRWRLLLALMTALALHLTQNNPLPLSWRLPHWIHVLAHMSYALFLLHFPIYMLVSALFVKYGLLGGPWSGMAGLIVTWLLSVVAAYFLHRWVELTAGRLRVGLPGKWRRPDSTVKTIPADSRR